MSKRLSKCLQPDHNTRETCKTPCNWRNDKCYPPERHVDPNAVRKPTLWDLTRKQVAENMRAQGLRPTAAEIAKVASDVYVPVLTQRRDRLSIDTAQAKQHGSIWEEFRRPFATTSQSSPTKRQQPPPTKRQQPPDETVFRDPRQRSREYSQQQY